MIIDTTGLEPGEYSLVLESFDEASNGVESTLKTDTITITIIGGVNQEILDTFSENLIQISATAGVPDQTHSISDLMIDLEDALGVSLMNGELDMTISLQTSYDFLQYGSFRVFVIPEPDLEAAVYKDASLIITIHGQQVTIPIEVTITACTPNLKFEPAKII